MNTNCFAFISEQAIVDWNEGAISACETMFTDHSHLENLLSDDEIYEDFRLACEGGYLEIVQMMINNGTDIDGNKLFSDAREDVI